MRTTLFACLALSLFAAGCATVRPDHGSASDGAASVSGTVTYLPRIALPPGAVATVRLLDVSLADAPSVTLAEQTVAPERLSVPFPFDLRYDADRIDARHRYVVRAQIRDRAGALLWTTDTAYPVVTNGAPTAGVEVRLVQVAGGVSGGASGAGALVGPEWHLVQIRSASGDAVEPQGDGGFTVSFSADGRFSGRADCNQYGGTFSAAGNGDLVLTNPVTTLAACAPPSSSLPFFGVVNQVVGFGVEDGRLTLRGAGGGALVFERSGLGEAPGMPSQETRLDIAYTCPSPDGPFTVRTRTGPGELAVWLPARFADRDGGTYLVLGQVRAASGAKYQDGPVTVWTKGTTEALVEVDGKTFTGCRP